MALLMSVGTIMGQADKAALKQAQKEAKAEMTEAQKINDAILAKINEKTATEAEIMSECKKGQALISKAIKSGAIAENRIGEAYKLSADLALQPHNLMLIHASKKEPFDTVFFYSNLKTMTDALQGELKNTKVTKGETGNEAYIKGKTFNLAQCGDYYIYAGQFNAAIGQFDKAIEAYKTAMNYTKIYPEVAGKAELRIPVEQIAYYAFHTAHEGKLYDKMDEFFDQAIKFEEGAVGTKQVKVASYLERGDSTAWANYIHDMTMPTKSSPKTPTSLLLSTVRLTSTSKARSTTRHSKHTRSVRNSRTTTTTHGINAVSASIVRPWPSTQPSVPSRIRLKPKRCSKRLRASSVRPSRSSRRHANVLPTSRRSGLSSFANATASQDRQPKLQRWTNCSKATQLRVCQNTINIM